MNASQEPDRDTVTSSVAALRQAWLNAVRSDDVERLAAMVTDDVVVVHGNGRCVCGRDELKADFLKGFEAFAIEQSISAVEVVVRGRWAVEIAEVATKLTPRGGDKATHVRSTTVVAMNLQADGSWKISRVLGVLDPP